MHFATAYNKFGENAEWHQPNVQTFFSDDELLIGKDFWNFLCKTKDGFDAVIKAYSDNIDIIVDALSEIKKEYSI